DGFWSMALMMAGYSFFWNAVMPQFEALTLDHLHSAPHNYSKIRIWGSVGYILAVTAGGYWFQEHINDFVVAGLILIFMIWLSSLLVPKAGSQPMNSQVGRLKETLLSPGVIGFLLMSFLLQVAHGIYYGFYSL